MCDQGPTVIIGGGRIGKAFWQMLGPHRASIVNRGESVAQSTCAGGCPILVATHASHLDDVLKQTAEERWKDLVFVQNGMLQPWLHAKGLEANTQMLLYMSASPEHPHGRMKVVVI